MVQLRLSEEQTRLVSAASESIAVCDARGNLLGYLTSGWSAEELAEAERAFKSDEPGYSYAEVKAHLDRLGSA